MYYLLLIEFAMVAMLVHKVICEMVLIGNGGSRNFERGGGGG